MGHDANREPRLLVIGCGGIGGVFCCHLRKSEIPFSIVTTNEGVRKAWLTEGPTLNGKPLGLTLPPERVLESAADCDAPFDYVFVAVQAPVIDEIATEIRDCLTDSGRVVVLSNGLCEERLARAVGKERVVGAVVAWGARMPSAGSYVRTSPGGFLVGKLTPQEEPQLAELSRLLEHVGPVRLTDNLRGARFSKLTINCAITALGTIGGKTLGAVLLHPVARNLALLLMHEAVQVAHAEGVALEQVAKIDLARWATHAGSDSLWIRASLHLLLLVVGMRYRRLRSSMLAAMERGRAPAIDYINGEIVSRGAELGVATPVNQAAMEMVWEIYHKRQTAGVPALHQVLERARQSSSAT
jgi:2-dehydropantoate 2-reductase